MDSKGGQVSDPRGPQSIDPNRRPVGYSGGRDWQWRMSLGTIIGTAGGVVMSTVASTAGLISVPRRAMGSVVGNAAIAAVCLAGSEEIVRELRSGCPEDTTNALIGGAMAGYALGNLKGGRALAPTSAVAFAVLGAGLHKAVGTVQEWRMEHMNQSLGIASPSNTEEVAVSLPTGSMDNSTVEEPVRKASAAAERVEEDLSKSNNGWVWPQWMPIRPATPEEIRKQEERQAKLMRERYGEDEDA